VHERHTLSGRQVMGSVRVVSAARCGAVRCVVGGDEQALDGEVRPDLSAYIYPREGQPLGCGDWGDPVLRELSALRTPLWERDLAVSACLAGIIVTAPMVEGSVAAMPVHVPSRKVSNPQGK
jgi:hypothetical protein